MMRETVHPVNSPVIAVDANPSARAVRTGTERFCAEVCARLPAAAPDLRFLFYASSSSSDAALDLTVLPARRLWSQLRFPVELWRHQPDLLFVPAHVVPFLSPPAPCLGTLHDLAFERYPDAYRPAELAYLRLTTRWAERRCRYLLTVSEATKRDLTELHGVAASRIHVVPPGGGEPAPQVSEAETARRLRSLGIDRPFVLNVGRVEARKNQLTALKAVESLAGLLFVIAGPERDPGLAAQLRQSPRCRVLGHVSPADLEALYARAEALCFPSLYEGFGFPVLEAMRRGLPVVTSASSSLPEVGGAAALYVSDPLDAGALAGELERALSDREGLSLRGKEQAARFNWERTATGIVEAIRSALA